MPKNGISGSVDRSRNIHLVAIVSSTTFLWNDGAIHSYRNRNGSEWTGPRLVEEEKMSLILGDASLT